jgi:formylglycine-generating enzyme required for sulfatase activity
MTSEDMSQATQQQRRPRPSARETSSSCDIGDVLSERYRLYAEVGRGTAMTVFRGVDVLLGHEVAIKVLQRPPAVPLEELRAAVSAIARLDHPSLARLFAFEQHGTLIFFVTEFVAGVHGEEHARARGGRLAPLELVRLGMECLGALAYAHSRRLHHQDIKPSSILISRAGSPKLCDLGVTSLVTRRSEISAQTAACISPERVRGDAGDHRSDLYSLAAALYTLGHGRAPFAGDLKDVLRAHALREVPQSPHLPPYLHEVLAKAMRKRASDRFDSASDMWRALDRVRRELARPTRAPEVKPPRLPPPIPHRIRSASRAASPPRQESSSPAKSNEGPAGATVARTGRIIPPTGMVEIQTTSFVSAYTGESETVRAFFLDAAPVTNEQFERFVAETGALPPAHWPSTNCPPHLRAHPVVWIDQRTAAAYADWAGKRLPTVLEWEAAAQDVLPWPASRSKSWNGPHAQLGETTPIGQFPDSHSTAGCMDLLGNVWEWTTDAAEEATHAWVMGGSHRHEPFVEGVIARSSISTDSEYPYVGFRCARSILVRVPR